MWSSSKGNRIVGGFHEANDHRRGNSCSLPCLLENVVTVGGVKRVVVVVVEQERGRLGENWGKRYGIDGRDGGWAL